MPKPTSAAEPAGASLAHSSGALPAAGALWSRAKPASRAAAQPAPMRVVLVTMDSHLASAAIDVICIARYIQSEPYKR